MNGANVPGRSGGGARVPAQSQGGGALRGGRGGVLGAGGAPAAPAARPAARARARLARALRRAAQLLHAPRQHCLVLCFHWEMLLRTNLAANIKVTGVWGSRHGKNVPDYLLKCSSPYPS